jgi:dolichyl-phosphate beta-glucosyltransferase
MRDAIALSVVIPAYNEAGRLPSTLRDLRAFLDRDGRRAEVIVVDDGSTDETSEAVRRVGSDDPRVRLIRLPQNRGKGYAVRTGVVNAAGRLVLFADADGATPFAELARLEEHLRQGASIAIGSRALRDTKTRVEARIHRRVAGRMFHAVVRLSAIRGFVDTQCGFKLFDASAAQDLFSRMRMTGYSFDVELLLMATRTGYRVAEVPVNWSHQPGSKVRVVRDGLRMAVDVLRIRMNAVRGLYDEPHIALPGSDDAEELASLDSRG